MAALLRGLMAALLLAVPVQASEWSEWDVAGTITEAAERHGVDAELLLAVAWCESKYDPYAIGDRGLSLGLFQLHRYGLQGDFWRQGYTDVWSAEQQADYAAWQFSLGNAGHWSCYWTVRS